jgi:hypothetical protein
MRLSWNEIRSRAAAFARDWAGHGYEKGQTQLFYRDLFEVFGMPVRRVATFEEPVKRLGEMRGFIDLFWKGVLLVEQKSAGGNRVRAKAQALDYFPGIRNSELPRYVLVSDFQTFDLYDLDEDEHASFALADLPRNVEKFGFILGVQKRSFKDQDPVNIEASELVGQLHDAMQASGYTGHDLEQYLVRLVFCLFADDTGIFEPREIFLDLLRNRTREDGSDLGGWLAQLFQVLNSPEDERARNLDEDLTHFPYINGDLFKAQLHLPSFDAAMRQLLLDACEFDWSAISPAIFGSLFQSVMEPAQRRAQGAHYTTEKNIVKVIEPLLLDELRAEFRRVKARKDTGRSRALREFQQRLGGLTFLDPACGCGNFLIIAYREIRELEIDVIRELKANAGTVQMEADATELSVVNVDQFYGIEIGEFPARIAETALWMMDHIMNNRLSLEFGQSYVRIPLRRSPHIVCADALETDWSSLLPPDACSYVLGNPPFIGAKFQVDRQRAQVRRIAALGKGGGTLDYVAAWFLTAGAYVEKSAARIGFVATNSITQGEQVAQLWPLLYERYGLEIAFAHRTFAWGSDARGRAHVHVVILGLVRSEHVPAVRRLFSYDDLNGEPHESAHAALSAYLADASELRNPHVVVRESHVPLNGMPPLLSGSQPIDDGNYIFERDERATFLDAEPGAERFLRPYVGAQEYLNGGERWILALQDATPAELRAMPRVVARMRAVREFRQASKRQSTLNLADYPARFNVEVIPSSPFLVIPEVSSERREYIPIGWLAPPTVPSNLVRIVLDAEAWHFALLTSAMHMAWARHIGGRLKSDYRYSIGLVYNTFPAPELDAAARRSLAVRANEILAARSEHAGATLSDLYDPDLMPAKLRRAHSALDRVVDAFYRRKRFESDRERAEHLLGLYERAVSPLPLAGGGGRSSKRRQQRRTG